VQTASAHTPYRDGATENAGHKNVAQSTMQGWKMRDMRMRHKMQRWKMRGNVCIESHNNVNAAEYIVCSFIHKTRQILSRNAYS